MARLVSIGFEHNSTTANVEWTSTTGSPTITSSNPRSGTYAGNISSLVSNTKMYFEYQFVSAAAGPYQATANFRFATLPSAENRIMCITDTSSAGTQVLWITIDNTGVLRLRDQTGQIGSASSALSTNTYYTIEIKVQNGGAGISTAVGRLNGSDFANASNRTLGNVSRLFVGGNIGGEAQTQGNWNIDDIFINDSAGNDENAFADVVKNLTLLPDASGDANAWTTGAGGTAGASNNYTRENEVTPNDVTTYNKAGAINTEDLYNVGASGLGVSDVITSVQVGVRFNASSSLNTSQFKLEIESTGSSTISQGPAIAPASTTWMTNKTAAPRTPGHVLYRDPLNVSWSKATLDTMQIGHKITTADATRFSQISKIWADVQYKAISGMIQYDAKSSGRTSSANGSTPLNITHVVGSDTNRAIYALISAQDSNQGNSVISTVTYGGVALTKKTSVQATGNNRAEVWYLNNPTTGSATLAITPTGGVGELAAVVVSLSGVDQSSPEASATNSGNSSTPSVAITTVTNAAWVLGVISSEATPSPKMQFGVQYALLQDQSFENAAGFSYPEYATAGSLTINYSNSSGQSWAMAAISVKPASATVTTTKTETGVSRVTATTTKTETGISRITAATTKTATGISRIQKSATQTETGVSRITVSTSKTATGVSRITATTTKTQSGVSRLQKSASPTETGVSRITHTTSQTESAVSRITASTTKTETGTSRLTVTTPQTQSGVSAIQAGTVTTTKTETGVSRITAQTVKTATGVSRIAGTTTKTATGVTRISRTRNTDTMVGAALSFNGTSSKVDITSNSVFQGMANLTISFWFKSDPGGGNYHKLFFKNGVYDIGIENNGKVFADIVNVKNFGLISSNDCTDGVWHHVVITYNGTTAKSYLDNVETNSLSVAGSPSVETNSNKLVFGYHGANNNEFFSGTIDEVRIYNQAWTAGNVSTAYNSRLGYYGAVGSGLVGGWHLDEYSGSTSADFSGNNNTASLINTTWVSPDVATTPLYGTSRITAATTKTETGVSRIQKSATQTETGISRLTVQQLKTETGVSSIINGTSRTQTGISSIRGTTTKTQSGVSSIRATTTKTASGISQIANTPAYVPRGVNISGLEFGSTFPGTLNTDFFQSSQDTYNYFGNVGNAYNKALNTVRLPFMWERAQPALNGALDSTYMTYIDEEITKASNANLKVILDLHNYGRRHVLATGGFTSTFGASDDMWQGGSIGSGVLSANHYSRVYGGAVGTPGPYKVQWDMRVDTTDGQVWNAAWFEVMRTDDNNKYFVTMNTDTDAWELYKVVAGVQTLISSGSSTFNTSTFYTWLLDVGNTTAGTLILKLGGSTVYSGSTDGALTGGQVALYGNGVSCSIDNVTLTVGSDATSATSNSGYFRIGDAGLTNAHFSDLWSRLATRYVANTTVYAYDLMNEPHDMPVSTTSSNYNTTSTWTLAAQAAITAIRAVDTTHFIIAELDNWAGGQAFTTSYGSNPTPWWTDPEGRLVYSFHYYFDNDHSGSYADPFASSNNTNISTDLSAILTWSQNRPIILHCGEYGVPNTSDWQVCLTTFLNLCNTYNVWANHWAAGDAFSSITTLQPTGSAPSYTNRLQMAIVGLSTYDGRIVNSTRTTSSGVSRITTTTPKTETGISRLTATVTRTETATSRITASTARTQTGISRIASSGVQHTETGVSRVTVASNKTATGVSRLQKSAAQTESGISRITTTAPKTEAGVSRIAATTSRGELGVARITITAMRTETGVSRMMIVSLKPETGIARVQGVSLKMETGITRVSGTSLQTMGGVSRIVPPGDGFVSYARSKALETVLKMGSQSIASIKARSTGLRMKDATILRISKKQL